MRSGARLVLVLLVVMVARHAGAQSLVTAPRIALFQHSDADVALTATYHLDLYQCGAVQNGLCQNQAAAPIAGFDIPKTAMTNVTPPPTDSTQPNRSISLLNASGAFLVAVPAGVPYIATLTAIADPNAGGQGSSGASAASNPFYAVAGTPARPAAVTVR